MKRPLRIKANLEVKEKTMNLNAITLRAVVELLSIKYPNTLPHRTTSNEIFNQLIGRQQVIKFLSDHAEVLESK